MLQSKLTYQKKKKKNTRSLAFVNYILNGCFYLLKLMILLSKHAIIWIFSMLSADTVFAT